MKQALYHLFIISFLTVLLFFDKGLVSYAYSPVLYDFSNANGWLFMGNTGVTSGGTITNYPVTRIDDIVSSSGTLSVSSYNCSLYLGKQTLTIDSSDTIRYTESTSGSTTTGTLNLPGRTIDLDISGSSFNSFTVPYHTISIDQSYNYDYTWVYEIPVYYILSGVDAPVGYDILVSGDLSFSIPTSVGSGNAVFTPDSDSGARMVYQGTSSGYSYYTVPFSSFGHFSLSGVLFSYLGTLSFYSSSPYASINFTSFNLYDVRLSVDQGVALSLDSNVASALDILQSLDVSGFSVSSAGTDNINSVNTTTSSIESYERSVFDANSAALTASGISTFKFDSFANGFSLIASITNNLYDRLPSDFKLLIQALLLIGASGLVLNVASHIRRKT